MAYGDRYVGRTLRDPIVMDAHLAARYMASSRIFYVSGRTLANIVNSGFPGLIPKNATLIFEVELKNIK